jgi:centromere protein S
MDLEDSELHARILCSAVAIAEEEAKKLQMTLSVPVMKALGNMVVQYMEILARDVEMFAQHAGRKTVNMDDVLLSARRNPDVAAKLMPLVRELTKASKKNKDDKSRRRKEPRDERHRQNVDEVAADSLYSRESPEDENQETRTSVEKRQRI